MKTRLRLRNEIQERCIEDTFVFIVDFMRRLLHFAFVILRNHRLKYGNKALDLAENKSIILATIDSREIGR